MKCRKYITPFLPYIYISFIISVLFWACSSSTEPTGASREVSDADAVIVFETTGWPDVTFTHQKHAEYWNNNCMECHMHTDVTDDTLWECSECHSSNDAENLCTDDEHGHDCMFVQCVLCHQTLDTDPTPDCSDCHVTTENTGQFVDSVVTGLIYTTPSLKGTTDSEGKFQYLSGETVTFVIGDVIIGSGTAKPVMTPVDIVPGAQDENNQTVKNIARFLQSLDDDDDPSNGITIPNEILNVIRNKTIDFTVSSAAFENNSDLQEILIFLNKTLVSENEAQTHLRTTLLSANSAPVASNVVISGSLAVDYTIEGIYTYYDKENDKEDGSTYKWYLSDDVSGTNKTEIIGQTTDTITLTSAFLDKYIIFEVTPGASSGYPFGTTVQSAAFGRIALEPGNSAPSATDCTITGPLNTYFVVSGTYNYYDIDNDVESGSTYQWYLADNAGGANETPIIGEESLIYHPQPGDSGKYLIFKATPAAATGISPGSTYASAAAGPITIDNEVTVFGSIDSKQEVDKYTIRLSTITDVTIDVLSSEGNHFGYCYVSGNVSVSCSGRFGSSNWPADLGFPNLSGDDLLISNIYVFNSDETAIAYRNGTVWADCGECHWDGEPPRQGLPGYSNPDNPLDYDHPDTWNGRSPRNPYMDMPGLLAGDYVVAIGAQYLTEADALMGTNNNPDSEIWGWADPSNGSYNNYKIIFTFN